MHTRIKEVLDYLTTAGVHLREAVDAVPSERRDVAPGPERWSVAQVIEHLSIVNGQIARLFAKGVARGRAAGVGSERESSSVLWTLDVVRVLDRRDGRDAPESARPGGGLTADAAWTALEQSHEAVRAAVVEADGLALGEILHTHPGLGPLNLYQWVAFAAAHEFRHAAQIREIAEPLARAAS
jgi:uncharacterized damage-inducible protein DinB